MRVFSTFSGIGGMELGILKAMPEAEIVGYSEIDRHAISIYQKNFLGHKNYGNIKKIAAKSLPDFDLLVGGFPCQSFSVAGKRKGFEDTRGTLFFDLARILRVKRPRLFIFENVKGLLSHDDGQTFKVIIDTLTDLRYDVQWQVLNSKDFGVPQNRERIFIVGHLRGTPRPEVFPILEDCGEDFVLPTLTARYHGAQANGGYIRHEQAEVGTYRTHKDGKGFRKSGNGLVPTILGRARNDGSGQPVVRIGEATKKGYAEAHIGDSINLSVLGSKTRRDRVGRGIAQTLDTGMHQYTIQDILERKQDAKGRMMPMHRAKMGGVLRRLTPKECERLQGFPDSWTAGVSDSQRYKCLGNAVTVNVVEAIAKRIK